MHNMIMHSLGHIFYSNLVHLRLAHGWVLADAVLCALNQIINAPTSGMTALNQMARRSWHNYALCESDYSNRPEIQGWYA